MQYPAPPPLPVRTRRWRTPGATLATVGAALALAGCAPLPGPGAAESALVLALPERTTDVEVRLTPLEVDAPPGSDAEPRFEVEIRARAGATRALGRPVLGAVSFNAGAAVLELDHRLVYERIDGFAREIAADVPAPPAASPDRSRIVYAVSGGTPGLLDVVVHDGSRRVPAGGAFASAGAFRFSDDAQLVAFVAAPNGGVAGAWIARTDGVALDGAHIARCLSACELHAGRSWDLAAAAADAGIAEIAGVSPDLLTYVDARGARRTLSWGAR